MNLINLGVTQTQPGPLLPLLHVKFVEIYLSNSLSHF